VLTHRKPDVQRSVLRLQRLEPRAKRLFELLAARFRLKRLRR
jgi:hypothetical protein